MTFKLKKSHLQFLIVFIYLSALKLKKKKHIDLKLFRIKIIQIMANSEFGNREINLSQDTVSLSAKPIYVSFRPNDQKALLQFH